MADLEYAVIVNLSTRGNLSTNLNGINNSFARLGNMRSALNGIGGSLHTLADGVRGVFEGAVESVAGLVTGLGKVAGVAALGAITYGATKLNDELERTQLSLATIFNANGMSNNMQQGMQMGAILMADMRKDAAKLPGEFSDLVDIFQMAASTGFAAGLSPRNLERMSAQTMAAAAATGVSMPMAARELSQLLSGHATAQNVLGQKVFGLVGDKSRAFNKMSSSDRTDFLTSGLEKFQPAIERYNNSFDAISSTLLDNAKLFLSTATGQLFSRLKGTMKELNNWFDANEDKVKHFANRIAFALGGAFDFAKEKVIEWGPVIVNFASRAADEIKSAWLSVKPIVQQIGSIIKDSLANGSALSSLRTIGMMYAGSKIAGGLMNVMPSGGSMLSMASLLGGSGGVGGAGVLGSMGSMLMNPAGLAVSAGAAVMLLGALIDMGAIFGVLTDRTSKYHDQALFDLHRMERAFSEIKSTFGDLISGASELSNALGGLLIGSLKGFVNELSLAANNISAMYHKIETIADAAANFVGIKPTLGNDAGGPNNIWEQGLPRVLARISSEAEKNLNKTTLGAGGGNHMSIAKVEIVVSSNQDPSRIARLTAAELANINRHPTVSRHVPKFNSVNG